MEKQRDTATSPVIFCTQRNRYWSSSSTPIISWTSKFSELLQIRQLTCLPTHKLKRYDETRETMTSTMDQLLSQATFEPEEEIWETMISVIELDHPWSYSGFLALRPCTLYRELKFRCYAITNSYDMDLVDPSNNIFLDSTGGTWDASSGTYDRHSFDYSIHCCVKPTFYCCVNDLPIEILEYVFSSFKHVDYYGTSNQRLFEIISKVCKLWKKVIAGFEGEPTTSKSKFTRLKQYPVKRYMWDRCDYFRNDDDVDFHEYIRKVVQFQPFLCKINIHRPFQDSPLEDLVILAKVPTVKEVTLYNWNGHEVFDFLRERQDLKLNRLEIQDMIGGNQEVTVSNDFQDRFQLVEVQDLTINRFDDWIHKILNCLQKDHLRYLSLYYDLYNFEPLKESIQLFGFENLEMLGLDGGNDESNLVDFDFISKTFTTSNLPNLHTLSLESCFIDPSQVSCLRIMPALKAVGIKFFMGQKTELNEWITNQMMKDIRSSNAQMVCAIVYSDGND